MVRTSSLDVKIGQQRPVLRACACNLPCEESGKMLTVFSMPSNDLFYQDIAWIKVVGQVGSTSKAILDIGSSIYDLRQVLSSDRFMLAKGCAVCNADQHAHDTMPSFLMERNAGNRPQTDNCTVHTLQ